MAWSETGYIMTQSTYESLHHNAYKYCKAVRLAEFVIEYWYMKTLLSEAGISGRDK